MELAGPWRDHESRGWSGYADRDGAEAGVVGTSGVVLVYQEGDDSVYSMSPSYGNLESATTDQLFEKLRAVGRELRLAANPSGLDACTFLHQAGEITMILAKRKAVPLDLLPEEILSEEPVERRAESWSGAEGETLLHYDRLWLAYVGGLAQIGAPVAPDPYIEDVFSHSVMSGGISSGPATESIPNWPRIFRISVDAIEFLVRPEVIDGPPDQEAASSNQEEHSSFPTFNATEELLLSVLGDKWMTGSEIAAATNGKYDSNLKTALSSLRKRNILINEHGKGYHRSSTS